MLTVVAAAGAGVGLDGNDDGFGLDDVAFSGNFLGNAAAAVEEVVDLLPAAVLSPVTFLTPPSSDVDVDGAVVLFPCFNLISFDKVLGLVGLVMAVLVAPVVGAAAADDGIGLDIIDADDKGSFGFKLSLLLFPTPPPTPPLASLWDGAELLLATTAVALASFLVAAADEDVVGDVNFLPLPAAAAAATAALTTLPPTLPPLLFVGAVIAAAGADDDDAFDEEGGGADGAPPLLGLELLSGLLLFIMVDFFMPLPAYV